MDNYYVQAALSQIGSRNPSQGTNLTAQVHLRQVPTVPEPNAKRPADSEFYATDENGEVKPNPLFLKSHFFREGRLTEEQALFVLSRATALLSQEPNVVEVQSPVTICGDIHGQYYDLMKLFDVGGSIHDNSYLFLGDYVDRGCFGIECLLYLYSLKLWYPNRFTLLRGNHECRHLTEYFTFKRECLHKYSPRVYEACMESFCALPVAAIVDGRFFCVHGGLSPELVTIDDLMKMNRFQEPGSHGLLCDLLWSDPIANFGRENEPTQGNPGLPPGTLWLHNATRGCSFFFTYEAACAFLERNGLLGIIRGHEAQDAGYTMHKKTPTKRFPSVITIFSAPNYLDVYHNRGAVIKYANRGITIRQYNSSPHPYWLPNFMDAFTWSLPFVGMKITEMLLAILSICSEEELDGSDSDEDEDARALMSPDNSARRQQIKSKIMAVGRMQRVFQLLREETENATELASGFPGLGVPGLGSEGVAGRSLDGGDGGAESMGVEGMPGGLGGPNNLGIHEAKLARAIRSFDDARRSDLINERLPEYDPSPTIFPASMRLPGRRGSGDEGINMEFLIKKTLEEESQDSGVVERLAEKIARGRKVTGRPRPLKRHETT
ncbi:Metallo-dependent phosphatase-like protein [Schizophyllum amplum]|uniref:Serine/threonine-protein phosphatase n=1 Tax=Schizophyllum amplum TaxID=97359 RepID=A0A550BVS1_9AGAR|nr:Metallo-dependent phosphatase-like protein [Auriculariopsis ampla]